MSGTIACPQAERALVSCVLHLPSAPALKLMQLLRFDDFSLPLLRSILTAAEALAAMAVPPDPITVLGELRRTGADSSFTADQGAGTYLASLVADAPNLGSSGHYLRVVLEHAWRRRVLQAGVRFHQASGVASLNLLESLVVAELTDLADWSVRWRECFGAPLEVTAFSGVGA